MESFRINSLIFLHLLLLSFCLVFEFFSINCNALGQCLQTESSTLLQLKRGFTSGDLDTWQLSTNCCIWEGVKCDESSGRVVGLDLSYRQIAGMIDPSIFNLTSLRSLNFFYNQFHGISIPNYGWDRLANLSSLDLSFAGFAGKIPVCIFRLTKLTFLDLSSHYGREFGGLSLTSKPILLQNMSSLRKLHLDHVDLSPYQNEWCRALANFTPALEKLSMIDCSLFGASCSSLSMLPLLYKLDLSGNTLHSNIFSSFVNFTQLSWLVATDNQFKGVFPKQIFLLKNLHYIDISYNPMLSGSLPKFSEDYKLITLELSGTNFYGNLPDTIGNLKFLKYLFLSGCQFSGRIPPSIGNLSQLEFLDLSNNNLQGHIPKSLFQISGLRWLLLGSNSFTGDFEFEFIKDLKNLVSLDLSNSGLSLNSWDAYNGYFVSSFPLISTLAIGSCNLTKIPTVINYQLNQLVILNFSNNHLTSFISFNITSHKNSLKYIFLANISLTGEIPPFIYNMTNLLALDLSNNMLTSSIPISPLPFTIIELLDFSNNHFTSFISFNITSHKNSLMYLFLANNSLTGEIPPFICNMTNLLVLDLSNNRLTECFNNFKSMMIDKIDTILDVTVNLFSQDYYLGSIPVGGQFFSFPSTSFEGNNGLCLLPCNTLVSRVNNTTISSDFRSQAPKNRRYLIILGILFGVGFGGSIALVVVFDVMCCDRSRRRRSRRPIDG
ncbi:hypothetical protein M5K25_000876 [Dendrobium thyrsiflorum]|uniref:Leucine-rich repeat-containing N-terminal plant-type domain-containing protein n=1 Tax=Dendrobium thyrsiflorum TaxID=117978 RepID=A0ABD0VXQ7_DENTH